MNTFQALLILAAVTIISARKTLDQNTLERQRAAEKGHREDLKLKQNLRQKKKPGLRRRYAYDFPGAERKKVGPRDKEECNYVNVIGKAVCGCDYLNEKSLAPFELRKNCIATLEMSMEELGPICNALLKPGKILHGEQLMVDIEDILGFCTVKDMSEGDDVVRLTKLLSRQLNPERNLRHLKRVVDLLKALEKTLKRIFGLKPSNNARFLIASRKKRLSRRATRLLKYNRKNRW